MNNYLEQVEFDTSNPEARCPCVLLLDVSGSMSGQRIGQLNEGLLAFEQALKQDTLASLRVEVAIVTFGGKVTVVQEFVTANQFQATILSTTGDTPMGQALDLGLDMVQERKKIYRQNGVSYYRPWLFLITDGAPTDGQKWQSAAQRIKKAEGRKSVAFFAVGVQGANMQTLNQIGVRQAVSLKGLNFREMFVWLSQSLTSVSHSQVGEQVPLKAPTGWAEV